MDWLTFLFAIAIAVALVIAVIHLYTWLQGTVGGQSGAAREFALKLDRLAEVAERTEKAVRDEHNQMRNDATTHARDLRSEVNNGIVQFGTSVQTTVADSKNSIDKRFEEFARTHAEFSNILRDEVRNTINAFGETLKSDVKALADANSVTQEALRNTVTERLDKLRDDNESKLEAMRLTVEEKLQTTLDQRLADNFTRVSERLEQVHKGLGEMQSLAIGVGDLKRVMSNVKDRGGWAEMQLGAMLEQMLTRDQYQTNARFDPNSAEVVEFAVRMPGQSGAEVFLPIDAKFPKEDYERLAIAWETGDADAARAAIEALATVFETEAKRISSKYIRPPHTTDFAVMYVPTEGLFAEAMRIPGLAQRLQAKHRVTVAGPSTLHALLNSLQMGFRTLAIQKRSSEVWRVLGEAKSEFQKYADVWDKVSKQLQTAQNTIHEASKRTRAVERKLKDVELRDLPADAQVTLELEQANADEEFAAPQTRRIQ